MRYSLFVKMRSQFFFFVELVVTFNLPRILYFLGAHAKLRKATVSFVMSVVRPLVCPSVRVEQFGCH
jgi:hypothetical protein